MIWLILLIVFISFTIWLLVSPLVIEADTRTPQVSLKWALIGDACIWYEDEWWLSFRVFFYSRKMAFSGIKTSRAKEKTAVTKKKKKKALPSVSKILRVIRTFHVTQWELGIDTGDYVHNAQLFPLNYLPKTIGHLWINFNDQTYFTIEMKNRPWKMLYAFIR